jgi:hypothetical protein
MLQQSKKVMKGTHYQAQNNKKDEINTNDDDYRSNSPS